MVEQRREGFIPAPVHAAGTHVRGGFALYPRHRARPAPPGFTHSPLEQGSHAADCLRGSPPSRVAGLLRPEDARRDSGERVRGSLAGRARGGAPKRGECRCGPSPFGRPATARRQGSWLTSSSGRAAELTYRIR